MATLRELKGRIGSVASSEKITGAMKMISSAKMHKAEAALRQLVPFRTQITRIIAHLLSTDAVFTSPLVESREVKHIAVLSFGSDDGLCGAYNINIYKTLVSRIASYREEYGEKVKIDVIPVGKKMLKAVGKLADEYITVSPLSGIDSKTEGSRCDDFMISLEEKFSEGTYDRVDVVYTHYYSAGRQRQLGQCLLPVDSESFTSVADSQAKGDEKVNGASPCLFEPSASDVFQSVIPLYLMAAMQEYFAQNRASEQAARVMAMQAANDNAKKLLDQLRLEYNKLRQQSITTELLDIVGGQVRD